MKIGFIGTGNMGGALARAAAKGGHTLLLANRTPAKAAALAKELGGTVCPNAEAAETAELLFLGVKPQGLPGLAGELAPVLQARKGNAPVVVSMATAVTLRELDAMLGGGLPLIRIMPNTPRRRRRGHDPLCRAERDGRAAERLPRRSGAGRAVAAPAGGKD